MSKPMNKTNETKTLIVTETVSYEFTVPASMAEDGDSLKRFFAGHPDPWRDADFAAVTEREFEIRTAEPSEPDSSHDQSSSGVPGELLQSLKDLEIILSGKPYDRDEQALLREARQVIAKGNRHLARRG